MNTFGPTLAHTHIRRNLTSGDVLTTWYQERATEIEEFSGQVHTKSLLNTHVQTQWNV